MQTSWSGFVSAAHTHSHRCYARGLVLAKVEPLRIARMRALQELDESLARR